MIGDQLPDPLLTPSAGARGTRRHGVTGSPRWAYPFQVVAYRGIVLSLAGSNVQAPRCISAFGSFAFINSDRQKRMVAMADTVLVVDDGGYFHELLRTFLAETGY